MTGLIDVHSHVGQFTDGCMSADGERLCRLLREGGVTHAVTFSIEACYGGLDAGNTYTLGEVAKHEMLSAMVVAHPHHREGVRLRRRLFGNRPTGHPDTCKLRVRCDAAKHE